MRLVTLFMAASLLGCGTLPAPVGPTGTTKTGSFTDPVTGAVTTITVVTPASQPTTQGTP